MLDFVARQPWGRPADRLRDIRDGVRAILLAPLRSPVRFRRLETGVEFRSFNAAQFVIVYAYSPPDARFPAGKVSIRAVRHRRVENVFIGVREPLIPYATYPAA